MCSVATWGRDQQNGQLAEGVSGRAGERNKKYCVIEVLSLCQLTWN